MEHCNWSNLGEFLFHRLKNWDPGRLSDLPETEFGPRHAHTTAKSFTSQLTNSLPAEVSLWRINANREVEGSCAVKEKQQIPWTEGKSNALPTDSVHRLHTGD